MSDLGLSNAPVSDGIGMRPPLPPGTRPTAPDSVPRGTPGAGPVVTPQDAARQNAASTSRMPVMSTDFVFGKGRAPPPGAGQVSAEPPPSAGSDDGAPPDHPVAAGVPMTAYGSETAHRFIDWIGKNEGADWGTLYGNAVGWSGRLTTEGVPIVNGVPWKGDRGPDGRPTHAFGKGQFQPQTYVTAVREINQAEPKAPIDVTDASPINQARVALHLAQKRDPHFLDKFAAGDYRGLSSTLTNEWTSLGKYGGGSGSSGPPNLQNTALGPFNDSAKALIQNIEADLQQGKERRDAEIARGTRLEDVAMSALQRWDDRSNHPPQNMHEAWSQWSGVAGALALLGGLGGRNMTAALAAGGTMLQAANASDERAYDKAYQQWKDHVDHGLKLSEMLFHQARNIVEDARKGYHDKVTELATLSTMHDLKEKLEPDSVYNGIKQLQKAKMLSDLTRANNEDTEIRLSAEAKDKEWLTANPQANGVVPDDIRNKHHGDAEQEHKGSSAAQQRLLWGQQQADAEIAATGATGDQKTDIYRKYGVIPQGRGSGALKGKDAAVQAIVDAEKAVVENAGGTWDKKAEAEARLKAAADYEERVAKARVSAGRPESAKDKAILQGYGELIDSKQAEWRDLHEGKNPEGKDLATIRIQALRDAGVIHVSSGNPRQQAANSFVEKILAETGHPPTYDDWVRFSSDQKGLLNGQLSPEAVRFNAKMYMLGDRTVITSLPRGGPARIQVENEIAKEVAEMGEDAGFIVMNRLRMAEATSAATTAGRITIQTGLYTAEAVGAGKLVIEASKKFTRTNFPPVNVALEAAARNTGNPDIIYLGVQLNALINAYGKMSNPTGTGIHDADKERISRQLSEKLSQGQIEAGVDAVILEARNLEAAAHQAQIDVLAGLVPRAAGRAAPTAAPPAGGAPPAPGARQSPQDGKWYIDDPARPGKYLEVRP